MFSAACTSCFFLSCNVADSLSIGETTFQEGTRMEEEKGQTSKGASSPSPDDSVEEETLIAEEAAAKKYGVRPKRKSFVETKTSRAFFDSADWALAKQNIPVDNRQPVLTLRPKLEPTPAPQALPARRASYVARETAEGE